jgi:hypothetical protein
MTLMEKIASVLAAGRENDCEEIEVVFPEWVSGGTTLKDITVKAKYRKKRDG